MIGAGAPKLLSEGGGGGQETNELTTSQLRRIPPRSADALGYYKLRLSAGQSGLAEFQRAIRVESEQCDSPSMVRATLPEWQWTLVWPSSQGSRSNPRRRCGGKRGQTYGFAHEDPHGRPPCRKHQHRFGRDLLPRAALTAKRSTKLRKKFGRLSVGSLNHYPSIMRLGTWATAHNVAKGAIRAALKVWGPKGAPIETRRPPISVRYCR